MRAGEPADGVGNNVPFISTNLGSRMSRSPGRLLALTSLSSVNVLPRSRDSKILSRARADPIWPSSPPRNISRMRRPSRIISVFSLWRPSE
jgi:hypothetical protein